MQPSPIEIPLSHIQARAAHRPPGYVERVLSMGLVVGDKLVVTAEAYEQLKAEFGGKGSGASGGCCGE